MTKKRKKVVKDLSIKMQINMIFKKGTIFTRIYSITVLRKNNIGRSNEPKLFILL